MQYNRTRVYQLIAVLAGIAIVYLVIARHVVGLADIFYLLALLPSVVLHELSHGVVANWCGDDTAKASGRLSVNPIRHLDPVGSLLVPGVMILAGLPAFGWAKPVPVNLARLRNPRNQSVLVALAGPATNIVLAAAAALAVRQLDPAQLEGYLAEFLINFGLVNVVLAVFNLIPIPPLDGSAVIERLLPNSLMAGYLQLRRFALPLVLILVFFGGNLLGDIMRPALDTYLSSIRSFPHL